ncbi:MAG: N-methylhydantoinase A, partial [Gammaproteobacteria bacterium]
HHRVEFDMRYGNQRVETPVASKMTRLENIHDVLSLIDQFHTRYGEQYGQGSQATESGVRINTVRVSSYVDIGKVDFKDIQPVTQRLAGVVMGTRQCSFVGVDGPLTTPVYNDLALQAGTSIDGPAVVTTAATTYLVEPGWNFHTSNHGAAWFTQTD